MSVRPSGDSAEVASPKESVIRKDDVEEAPSSGEVSKSHPVDGLTGLPPGDVESDLGLEVSSDSASTEESGDEEKVMTLVEHLSELRMRLLISLGTIALLACFTLWNAAKLTRMIASTAPRVEFIALTPVEVFFTEVKIGLLTAFILGVPLFSWQAWLFIRPGLKHHERAFLRFLAPLVSILFVLGAAFAYCLVVPVGVGFLSTFSLEGVKAQYSLAAYTSFVLFFVLVLGLLFECPLVLIVLAKLGLVNHADLSRKRRHVLLACFIVAALLTPTPDMVTQSLVALPMWLLFEGTLLVMKVMKL